MPIKKPYMVMLIMAMLGFLAGLFYDYFISLIGAGGNLLLQLLFLLAGMMFLNLLILRLIPLSRYSMAHPVRLLAYTIFIISAVVAMTTIQF
ncbi:hypothetical protein [Jeotgalibacillus sp. R-1-5s-1]|uniref:hypothetical protein n=1 Tax=Jeotgalibacillus sp. R-1-5s-1 TaxID=2555897 RepID=UPI00106CEC66|nr:hypothetical protein [Jeotgalibacillus sp. R-1-5s-1]TFE00010.1 hypothetical protein E2491_06085 [Jeotgalibacillus sp. R-1-5s-1]